MLNEIQLSTSLFTSRVLHIPVVGHAGHSTFCPSWPCLEIEKTALQRRGGKERERGHSFYYLNSIIAASKLDFEG